LLSRGDPLDPIPARDDRYVRPQRPRFWGRRESLAQIGRHPGFRVLSRRRHLQRNDVARVGARSFAHLSVHFKPVAFLAIWLERGSKGKPLIVPSTVVMPREGSFALASFGRVRKVQEPTFAVETGRNSFALKRILEEVLLILFGIGSRSAIHFHHSKL
jgi:hypothetical protein